MDGVVFLLFAGPHDRVTRAERVAERAGYSTTPLAGRRSRDVGFLELFDVMTDPAGDPQQWRRHTVAIATGLMAVVGLRRVAVSTRHGLDGL